MYPHCSRVGLRRMAPRQRAVPWLLLLVGLTAAGLAGYGLSGMDEARLSSTLQAQAHEKIGLPALARQVEATLAAAVPVTPDVSAQDSLPDDAPSPAAEAQTGRDPVPLAGRNAALQTSAGIASTAPSFAARVATGLGSSVPDAVSAVPTSAVTAEKSTVLFLTPSQARNSVDARRIKRPKAAPASAECNDALRAMQLCDARSAQRP
jgi:predicted secreted protein